MLTRNFSLLVSASCLVFTVSGPAHAYEAKPQLETYSTIVYQNYSDAYETGLKLQKAVDAFLADPTENNLAAAKTAWLAAREPYGQTEAFRFYEGPIDFVDEAKGEEGPEGRLNAWPLNEAYIDYVKGNAGAGIVQDTSIAITEESLKNKNQADDEADVATGYHAIEFLLWGQDSSLEGPGARAAADYAKGDPVRERRRAYLREVTGLLVDDLRFLKESWEPGKSNYAKTFLRQDQKKALTDILTGLATLSGFELASERMATALDSGDQEDEHSCFSDNTHNDFILNARGIWNVYFGKYRDYEGPGLHALLMKENPELAQNIAARLGETEALMAELPHPIDREILATPKGSPAREKMEEVVASLQKQADLFKEAGKTLGLDVHIGE